MAVKGVRTIALATSRPDAAERFFTQILGGKVKNRIQHPGQGGTISEVFIDMGNARVALASLNGGGESPSGFPHYTLNMEYQPQDMLVKELGEAGIPCESIRTHQEDSGYSCYVRDPDGNLFELSVSAQEG